LTRAGGADRPVRAIHRLAATFAVLELGGNATMGGRLRLRE
jgi:hypothetical protein